MGKMLRKKLRRTTGSLKPHGSSKVMRLARLLQEAGDLLGAHHEISLCTWFGECPVCSKKHTESYPHNIFGRIERELKFTKTNKEINAELGLTDETGDDALRKGLETIKALKTRPDWVKFSDVKPLTNIPVLILAETYLSGEPIICSAVWDGDYWFSHGASGYDCELEFDTETITHWMPLPEPPKGVDQ